MDSICLKPGITVPGPCHVTTAMPVEKPAVLIKRNVPWGFSLKYPLRSLFPGGKKYEAIALDEPVLMEERETERNTDGGPEEGDGNWVMKILHLRSAWGGGEEREEGNEENDDDDVCRVDDDDDRVEFDRSSFSKLLRRVSLSEARLYARMSYLGNLAYCIPDIKPKNLLKIHGLRFITSSLEKKEMAMKAEKGKPLEEDEPKEETSMKNEKTQEDETKGSILSPSGAYQYAASAASYIHSQTKSIISFTSSKSNLDEVLSEENNGTGKLTDNEIASLVAKSTDVVAAKEEVKQAVADDLNSTSSSPCEWYICDDDLSGTRYFVIQGSESLASWQANLLFEPIQFEGLDVPVHRGIYEAAKGMYEQMLPEVHAHLKSQGDRATFRFTGHSLGGSLSLLINLMLLKRGEVASSSLLPVVTFGAPSIMCGGDRLLHELGLPRGHVQSITMHRDIVPRAFSCNYPSHVAELLKAVNGNFRNHPCLNNQKLLYAPMGELLILQPDEKHSPSHDLLPPGSGLYLLECQSLDTYEAKKQLRAAKSLFLNSPHPLEILSDRSAYGSDGTVQRDHDMNSYLKSVRSVIRQELSQIRRTKREQRHRNWWPLIMSSAFDEGIIEHRPESHYLFSGILKTGTRSLTRFSRLVASQNANLLVVLLVPARLLVLGTFGVIKLVY